METVSIIGPGRLGGALAIAMSRAGFSVERLIYRSNEPAAAVLEKIDGRPAVISFDELSALDSDLILLTTADTEIAAVADSIAPKIGPESVLLHTSGALSSEVLAPARRGIATGSMHPLVSVSDPLIGADSFAGAFFCIEGHETAVAMADKVVHSLGGTPFSIDTKYKPLYHASAVLASGLVVALFAAAAETLSHCEIDASRAKEVLFPLLESSVANLSKQSIPEALTGPFARTDLEAVERHLNAFETTGLADEKRIYLELGLKALQLAEMNNGDSGKIDRIRNVIKLALESGK